MVQCKLLCEFQTLQFGKLINCLCLLTKQINELLYENSSMNGELVTLKNRVKSLETNVLYHSMAVYQLIYESTEHERYSTNLIAHYNSESTLF